MNVRELSREELTELKCNYYQDMKAQEGEGVSYGELAEIDELVSDEEVFAEYDGTAFVKDDFFCNQVNEEEKVVDICENCVFRYKNSHRCNRFVGSSIGGRDWLGSDFKDSKNNTCKYFEEGKSNTEYSSMPLWNS